MFSRQLILGDNLDTQKIAATYQGGVLRLEIPMSEKAKPRKISVNATKTKRSSTPDRTAAAVELPSLRR